MQALEEKFERATATGKLPAVVLAAASKDGSLEYFKPFGKIRLEEDSPLVSSDTTFCLASVTKLVTSVAAMQLVERGSVDLDDDITKFLPEWKYPHILVGFGEEEDGEKPLLIPAQNQITLRQLLSHTSGIASLDEGKLMKYYTVLGDSRGTVLMRYFKNNDPEVKAKALEEIREAMSSLPVVPLFFEPGTNWGYGQSTDWAGQIVERVTNMTLEQYCQENIFKPLGMTHTTYRLLDNPHVAANLIQMTSRGSDGIVQQVESVYPINPKVDMGGSNLYTSGTDFLKFLSSLLRNDGKLLRPETTDFMFDYGLPKTETFRRFRTNPEHLKDNFGDLAPVGMEVDHCLAGIVTRGDLLGGRKAGSISWQGATRCYWWIDRKAGLCGFYGSQIMVPHDQGVTPGFIREFEKTLYDVYEPAATDCQRAREEPGFPGP